MCLFCANRRLRCDYLSGSEDESGDEYQRDADENMMADTLATIQPVRQQAAPDPPYSSPVNHPGDDPTYYERVSDSLPIMRGSVTPTVQRGSVTPTVNRGSVTPTVKRGSVTPPMTRGSVAVQLSFDQFFCQQIRRFGLSRKTKMSFSDRMKKSVELMKIKFKITRWDVCSSLVAHLIAVAVNRVRFRAEYCTLS